MGRIAYSGVVLDDKSRTTLLNALQNILPDGYEIIAHHMTINLGELKPEYKQYVGNVVNLVVSSVAGDDKVVAAGVSLAKMNGLDILSNNKQPHITLAVNRGNGGKPYMSNNLLEWKPLKKGLNLSGIITEVEY